MGRRKRRGREKLTVIVIPEGGRQVRQLAVPVRFLWGAALGLLGLVAATVCLAWYGQALSGRVQSLRHLEAANREQAGELARLREKASETDQKLREIDRLEAEVRRMVGLPLPKDGGSQVSRGLSGSRPPLAAGDGQPALAEIRHRFESLDGRLDAEEADLAALKDDLKKRLAYLAAVPSGWPLGGEISSGFGTRRSPFGRRSEFHDGLDIAGNYGAAIRAAGSGVVTSAGYLPGYGRTVAINHGYGLQSRYCHLSTALVEPGQRVERGQVIGRVGSSGRSTGPHLHFMVFSGGSPVDPTRYLKKTP
ncbi:MAG: peptidoglycan DD-metalloendopeptidase family protein [Bacillota bacterium]|nr:peptidoglycan DD-metalloendopeptidase family protein [Bacillota bacterium]